MSTCLWIVTLISLFKLAVNMLCVYILYFMNTYFNGTIIYLCRLNSTTVQLSKSILFSLKVKHVFWNTTIFSTR